MSAILSAKKICEEALGAGGAFPTSESAAAPEQLRRAMSWLDLIMAEKSGVGRLFFLIPATLSMPIENGTASYNLNQALGSDLPVDKIQFPVEAWLEDAEGNRSPIEISTLEKFEAVSNADQTGTPVMIHIDRLPTSPVLRIRPFPAADSAADFTLKLVVQTYAPNVAPGGVTGTLPSGSILTGFRQAWQRWLIWQLAADLFVGPIFKLPKSSTDEFQRKANLAMAELERFENDEHDTEPPIADSWDRP